MADEIQILLHGLVTLLLAIVGWIVKRQYTRFDDLEKDFGAHKLHVYETHPTRVEVLELKRDVTSRFDRIDTKLDMISDKMDGKADRGNGQ